MSGTSRKLSKTHRESYPLNHYRCLIGYGETDIPVTQIILLMLRGRHRGLPLAIDRAAMFPIEYNPLSSDDREKVGEDRVGQAGEEANGE